MGTAVAVDGRSEDTATPEPRRLSAPEAWWPAGILAAVAALLWLPRLGTRPMWLDETYTVGATNELFPTLRETAGTQALFYVLEWPVSRLSTDPVWLRLPAAILGVIAVVVVWRVGRRIGGQREGLLAAGGLAMSWGLARYSMEARSYTLALVLVSVSWLALVAAVQSDGDEDAVRRWWRIYYVAAALIPFSHGLATLNYPVQLLAIAVAPAVLRRRLLRRALPVAPVIAAELGVLFMLGAADIGDWVPPLSMGQMRNLAQLLLGYLPTGAVLGVIAAGAVVLAVRRYLQERSTEAWIRLLPVFWAIGPPAIVLLMSLFRPYASARYVFTAIPGFFLLFAALIGRLESPRRLAAAVTVVGALLLVDQPAATGTNVENWEGLLECVAENAEEGDRMLTPWAHRTAFDYFWSDDPGLARLEWLSPSVPYDGEVHRLYENEWDDWDGFRELIVEDDSRSIWFVHRGDNAKVTLAGLAFDEVVSEHFEMQEPFFFKGGFIMTRFDPKGSDRPRNEEPCDTTPAPKDMRPPDARED